jgi:hypothetical protein
MIIWDKRKDAWLRYYRKVSFEFFADIIEKGEYADFHENPSNRDHNIFIIEFNEYTYVIPFDIDGDENIILRTIYPSRKYNKFYKRKS